MSNLEEIAEVNSIAAFVRKAEFTDSTENYPITL
jgi:hypothetical protein